jgi:uncharacterized membrane protein
MRYTPLVREGRAVSDLHFFPIPRVFLAALALVLAVVAVAVELDLVSYAYERIGIAPQYVLLLLLLSLVGSAINVPLAVLQGRPIVSGAIVTVQGVPYVVPAVRRHSGTVLAINLGGAVIPVGVSTYLLLNGLAPLRAIAATLLVTGIVHRFARPVRGVGIAVPIWIAPLAAAGAGLALGGSAPAATAYVAGTLGTLIGGDVLNLRKIGGLGAPVASIGGAGTFDGVFLTGILAVLLA